MLITKDAFNARKNFLCAEESGYLHKIGEREAKDPGASMASMNSSLMDGMKGNFMMMFTSIPAILWISYFFSGFIVAKVPFSLTQKFRPITQSGIEI